MVGRYPTIAHWIFDPLLHSFGQTLTILSWDHQMNLSLTAVAVIVIVMVVGVAGPRVVKIGSIPHHLYWTHLKCLSAMIIVAVIG
jgi:hypothetical protein